MGLSRGLCFYQNSTVLSDLYIRVLCKVFEKFSDALTMFKVFRSGDL